MAQTDVFEFAWQGLVQGAVGVLQVIRWLLATSLAPLDFRKHWCVLTQVGDDTPPAALTVLRQVLIAAGLLLGLALPPILAVVAINRVWQGRTVQLSLAQLSLAQRSQVGPLPEPGVSGLLLMGGAALLTLLSFALLGSTWLDVLEVNRIGRRTRAALRREWRGLYADHARAWRVLARRRGVRRARAAA